MRLRRLRAQVQLPRVVILRLSPKARDARKTIGRIVGKHVEMAFDAQLMMGEVVESSAA